MDVPVGGCWRSCLWTFPIFLLHFLCCVSYFILYHFLFFFNQSEESIQILIKAGETVLCHLCNLEVGSLGEFLLWVAF